MSSYAKRLIAVSLLGAGLPYEEAKARVKKARDKSAAASAVLQKFPKGPSGLTPDHVKNSPEFRAAKAAYDRAFAEEQRLNSWFVRTYKKEYQEDRRKNRRVWD